MAMLAAAEGVTTEFTKAWMIEGPPSIAANRNADRHATAVELPRIANCTAARQIERYLEANVVAGGVHDGT